MSARPQSINDEMPVAKRLRRDQFKRISTIIDVNSKFPVIALGLIRDYLKGNADIASIRLDDADQPTAIIVNTAPFNGLKGTEYQFKLQRAIRIETPTLH